ncbi:MAG TPA: methyltransferase domain-containing protein [Terriglobia bacterium]|jgi:ubiquinone/menaquinone biosynthesis C-methylase UbiE
MALVSSGTYIMEDPREASRLARKVDPDTWTKKYLDGYLFSGAEVLSVGCGPGNIARAITKRRPGIKATGLDLSPTRIQQANQGDNYASQVRFVCGDARQMKFPSGSFDVVYTRMLLQYIQDKEAAVAEMVRVCKPGGVVLMQDLDGQLVWHYPEEELMQETIQRVMKSLAETGFDPLIGRKLFWHGRNAGLENLRVQVECYHLIAGKVDPYIFEQWELKLEIARPRLARALGSDYEAEEEIRRFLNYLRRPDTLTYSTLFTVTGEKPQ